jgi:putative tryptophan/tyrosine transport system substrate-binding protein
MRLIGFAVVLALGLVLAPLAATQEANSQPSKKIPVVGILHPGAPDPTFPSVAALREGLNALGYVEGQNIRLEYRWAGGKVEELPRLAASLVRLNVDVLYATGPQAMRAAIGASRTVAIVADNLEDDPVESGFAASIGRPGGNVTGLFLNLPDLTGKWVQLIKEVVPSSRRVAVLWDATTNPQQLRAVQKAAQAATIEVRVVEVRRPTEYVDVLQKAMKERPDALIQLSSPLIRQASPVVAEFTRKNRLPATSMFRLFAETGGLMAYGPDLPAFFGRSASYVDRILKGAKPGDLPVEQPTKFELVINLRTAKALGLTIPQPLLLRADQVIDP